MTRMTEITPEEVTPEQIREAAESKIKPLGAERLKLLKRLDTIDRELRPLVASARRAEVSFRRVTELTGLSANTVKKWVDTGTVQEPNPPRAKRRAVRRSGPR